MGSQNANPPSQKYFSLTYPASFVAHVEINRPEKLNAFIEPYDAAHPFPLPVKNMLTRAYRMWNELPPLFSHLSTSPSTRVVILSGAGSKAFTTGLDVQAASQNSILSAGSQNTSLSEKESPLDAARIATHHRRHIDSFQRCITAIEKCEKPVIVALHGWSLGLAIDIALCADVRICAKETVFAVKEVDVGLAADIGTLSRLPKVVGNGSWVKDVCLSARYFGADEAERMGLVSWVGKNGGKEEVIKEAVRWAELVASKSPVAVQATKEILNWSWSRSVEDGLRYTSVWNSSALQSNDVQAAMMAGIKKQKASFAKL